jgi:uncharacterized membrane protein
MYDISKLTKQQIEILLENEEKEIIEMQELSIRLRKKIVDLEAEISQINEDLNRKNSMLFEISNKKSIWKKIALPSAATSAFVIALFNKE